MKYSNGKKVMIGDQVRLGDDTSGIVVCLMEEDHYTDEYPRSDWGYLKKGILVEFESYGLIHFIQLENDLQLLDRSVS